MSYWLGVDGGGSSLRVVIVDDDLNEIARIEGESANPNSIGHDRAAERIQSAVKQTLHNAGLTQVNGAGIGIAGASDEHAADWLISVLSPLIPASQIKPSSDMEIALVGGRGRLDGILILAGTGSVALGIASDGRRKRLGGWGYLLGDEGSGYWIGTQALNALTGWADGTLGQNSALPEKIMRELGFKNPLEVIPWRYQKADQRAVAALAPLVLDLATGGDPFAGDIIKRAAEHLANMGRHLMAKLDLSLDEIVFGGGLLSQDTPLCRALIQTLALRHDPSPCYSAVVGAALLAKLTQDSKTNSV